MKKNIFFSFVLMIYCFNLVAQGSSMVIPLWENGAPGFENKKTEKEIAKDWWIKNIHNPSVIVYFPERGRANGAAVIVCPGGGHRELVFNPEGKEAAGYFKTIGVITIVLKYRLFREEGWVIGSWIMNI